MENYTTENDIEVSFSLYLMTVCVICSLNGVIGVCGNTLVLITIYSIPSFHTVSNVLLASLSCVDILSAIIGTPMAVYVNVYSGVTFSDTSLKGDVFYIPLYLSCPVSVLHLLLISLDRYFAIFYPYKYQSHATIYRASYFIVLTWLTGITLGLVPLFGGLETDEDCLSNICKTYSESAIRVYEIMSAVGLMITLILVVLIYARIFFISKKISNNVRDIPGQNLSFPLNTNEQASLQKTIKATAMVVGGFFVCWSPRFFYMIFHFEYVTDNVSINIFRAFSEITCLASISINPFIYNFKLKSFRDGFRRSIRIFEN